MQILAAILVTSRKK